MHKPRWRPAILAALCIVVYFSNTMAAAESDTLQVAEMWDIDSLDPAKHGTFVKEKALIAETLVEANPDFSLKPGLAISWKRVSDTDWEFTLRPGVLFHNHQPLTAACVAASINRTLKMNPATVELTRIRRASAAGDLTVILTTNGLFPPLPAALVYADMAVVHPDSAVNDQGIITHPVGTGPYALKVWNRAEQQVVLIRNDAYWGDKGRIRKIVFRSIPDPATRSLEVQKGSIDVIADAPYGDLDLLRKKGMNVIIAQTARVYQLNFGSLQNTPFSDQRVRLALSMAINREEIVRYVLFGMGKPAAGAYDSAMSFANAGLKPHDHAPAKAEQLLEDAGWRDKNHDGIREKKGRDFSLTLYTYPQRPGLKPMAMAIQQQWNRVGVKTNVRVMDYAAIDQVMKAGDVRLAAFASAMIPDPDYFLRRLYAKSGSNNTWGYENDAVERLLDAGILESNPAKRLKLYKQAQALVFSDLPVIHVAYYGVNIVTRPEVKGFVFNPVAHDYMLNTHMYLEQTKTP